jgi:hypothetical protein
MSLFKSLVSTLAPIVGTAVGGPVGGALGAFVGQAFAPRAAPPVMASAAMPSLPSLPAMGSLPAVGGAVVRAGIAGGRAIIASARYYCARYPGWCLSIGGLGAVEGLVRDGQLPMHRRRRGKGISARDFRGFRRVHNILSGFCAPRMKVRRKALRS